MKLDEVSAVTLAAAQRIRRLEAALRVARGYLFGPSKPTHEQAKRDLRTIDAVLDRGE